MKTTINKCIDAMIEPFRIRREPSIYEINAGIHAVGDLTYLMSMLFKGHCYWGGDFYTQSKYTERYLRW